MTKKIIRSLFLSSTFLFLLSCFEDKKFPRKNIYIDEVEVVWYYESYISNTRAFVSIDQNGKSDIVVDCNDFLITDITNANDTIIVKMYKPKNSVIYSFKPRSGRFTIKIDSSATGNDYDKIYQPQFYKPGQK